MNILSHRSQSLILAGALSYGCSTSTAEETSVPPQWVQSHTCDMRRVNADSSAQRLYVRDGNARPLPPSVSTYGESNPTAQEAFGWSRSHSGSTVCLGNPYDNRYDTFVTTAQQTINITHPTPPSSPDLYAEVQNLRRENLELRREVEQSRREIKSLRNSFGISIVFNIGLGLLTVFLTAMTVFLTGRRTAFQSVATYKELMDLGIKIDLTTWSARYDMWQFRRFGFSDFIRVIKANNQKIESQEKVKTSKQRPL